MWRLKMIGFLMLVIIAAGAVTAEETKRTTPPVGPFAVVEKAAYSFPVVVEGTEVRHDFVIRNAGDAPLIIKKVHAG